MDHVDGVVVATPPATHAAVAGAALGLGVPVFVEKPLTDSAALARTLAASAPGRLFVMDKWRYHPLVHALRDLVEDGEIGRVQHVVTRRESWSLPGHNAVWRLLPHDLAATIEILGYLPDPRSATLERVGESVVGMHAELGDAPTVSITVSGVAPAHYREMRVLGEDGLAWFVDGWSTDLFVARRDRLGEAPERRVVTGELPLLAELRAFVAHVRGGPPPRSDGQTGADVVAAIEQLLALGAHRGAA